MKTAQEYELTQDELTELLDACRPVPVMLIGGIAPRSAQQNVDEAWRRLGDVRGFEWETVAPSRKGERFFFAVPKDPA